MKTMNQLVMDHEFLLRLAENSFTIRKAKQSGYVTVYDSDESIEWLYKMPYAELNILRQEAYRIFG